MSLAGWVILAVHGNPGFPQDFAPLQTQSELNGARWQTPDPTDAAVTEALTQAGPQTVLLGYSWGAYQVMRVLQLHPELRPAHVVLITPYLENENALSSVAKFLASTPGIADLLVQLSKKKWKDEFLPRMFTSAELPAGHEYAERLRASAPWKHMLVRKILQQDEALLPFTAAAPKVHVIFAAQDRITSRTRAETVLIRLGVKYNVSEIPGTGHGLPFTHPAVLAQILLEVSKGNTP